VGQINAAVAQLSQTTQQNASSSEELAATAEEMSSQAEQLQQTMSFFRMEPGSSDSTRGVRPPARKNPSSRSPIALGKAGGAKKSSSPADPFKGEVSGGFSLSTGGSLDESQFARY
jgi:methyl-accepting chemotaxis protein